MMQKARSESQPFLPSGRRACGPARAERRRRRRWSAPPPGRSTISAAARSAGRGEGRDARAGELPRVQVDRAARDEARPRRGRPGCTRAGSCARPRRSARVDDVHLGGLGGRLDAARVAQRVADQRRVHMAHLAAQEAHREGRGRRAHADPHRTGRPPPGPAWRPRSRPSRCAAPPGPRPQTARPASRARATSASEKPACGPTSRAARPERPATARSPRRRAGRSGIPPRTGSRPAHRRTVPAPAAAAATPDRTGARPPRRRGPAARGGAPRRRRRDAAGALAGHQRDLAHAELGGLLDDEVTRPQSVRPR